MVQLKNTRPTGISLGEYTRPTGIPIGNAVNGGGAVSGAQLLPSAGIGQAPTNSANILQPSSGGRAVLPVGQATPFNLNNITGYYPQDGTALADGSAAAGTAGAAGSGGGVEYPDLSGAIALLMQNLGLYDPLYEKSVARADEDYKIAENERLANFNSAKQASDTSAIDNDSSVLQSRNAINKNARLSAEQVMSILGALGMGGSTRVKALSSIADKSNTNMNEANYGYGKNKQSILQSWNDFINKDKNQQKQIVDAREYAKAQAGIARDTGKKDILTQIAGNKIQMGQGTDNETNQIAGLNQNITNLSGVPRTYTGETPTYSAPAISSLLGQNMARFDVSAGQNNKKSAPKLIKVNEQSGKDNKYGLV